MKGVKDYIKLPIVAIQFLTRIPIFPNMAVDREDLGRSLAFFPLVGALIAVILGITAYVGLILELPFGVIAALLLILEATMTGAFHWDGLADTFDGFYSTHKSRQEMLDIMHDSRTGVMGATAIALIALLQFSCLTTIIELKIESIMGALLSTYVFSKWGCTYLSVVSAYGRREGKGLVFLENARWPVLFVASLFLVPIVLLGARYLAMFAVVLSFIIIWGIYSYRKVGGVTGDILGASARLSETLNMLIFLILYQYI